MDGVPEALWSLADEHSRLGRPAVAIKCLESIVQSSTLRLLPTVEISTRLRLADLLLLHTHNLNKAKSHLERAHLLLHSAPASAFHLKCRAHALLARCYNLLGAIQPQRLMLQRAVEFVANSAEADSEAGRLWTCNFYSQLAGACGIAGDHHAALGALDKGFEVAVGLDTAAGLQMYFATMTLHVHLLDWKDIGLLEKAIQTCKEAWEVIHPDHRQQYLGLFFYHKLLHAFYLLRMCDYKGAGEHIEKLDTAMKNDLHLTQQIEALASEYNSVKRSLSRPDLHNKERLALSQKYGQLHEQLRTVMFTSFSSQEYDDQSDFESAICTLRSKLQLAPFPIDGEWLPKCAVYAIVDLMAVMLGRPKGLFKDCGRRIQSGLDRLHEELGKLGITNDTTEVDMRNSDIWMVGLYLNILMHFLENKVAIELTRSEFVEAREALTQMIDWYVRFPVLLQGCESIIEMLRGLYSHSLGCLGEAIFHFMEAIKVTTSKPVQTMCQVYAAVSYICIGDAESSSQALDLIGPIYRVVDSFVGVREKTCVIFVYGLLLMKQQNLQESRIRLASGLKIAHQHLGNIQLVSQFLTILGSLALQLHDTAQAREILKSSLTLAKTLYDVPTQIWVLSVLTDLYKEIGDRGNEMENAEYERKKEDDLQKRLSEAQSSVHHYELIEKSRVAVKQVHVSGAQRASDGSSIKRELEALDIPESVGIHTPPSVTSLPRLRGVDTTRRGKKKI